MLIGISESIPSFVSSLWAPAAWGNAIVSDFDPGRSDLVTTVDAAVTSQDLRTWSTSGASAPTAGSILATAGAGAHFLYQVAGLYAGHGCTYYAELKYDNHRYVVFTDNNTPIGIVDLQTGTAVVQTNCSIAIGAQQGDGYWPVTVTVPRLGQGYIAVGLATNTTYSFTAAGAESVLVRNMSVTQRNTSSIVSAAGSATLAQATAANRPWYTTLAGIPCLYGDGVNDRIGGAFTVGAQPWTMLWCGKYAAAYAATDRLWSASATTTNLGDMYRSAANTVNANAGATLTRSVATDTTVHAYGVVYDGALSSVWQDGAQISTPGDAGSATATGLTLFAGGDGSNPANAYCYRSIIVAGALSAADMLNWRNYCKRVYGAA